MPVIALTNLLLDVINPRFVTEQDNQRVAIRNMASEQGEKLLNLADDIVNFGVDPSSLAIVIPHAQNAGRHIVVEGNRRVAALKLLHNPELLQGAWEPQAEHQLRNLSDSFGKAPINDVQCVVLQDREAANHWILLRHRGEQQGRGIVAWDGTAAARYEERRGGGRAQAALQAIDLVRQKGKLDQPVLDRLGDVPITTVQRLLNDPQVRTMLGVDLENGKLTTRLPEQEVLKGLTRIIRDAALGQLKVSRVDTKEDRANYVGSFGQNELPAASVSRGQARVLSIPPGLAPKQPKLVGPSSKRPTLIPRNCRITILEVKSNDIYHELRHIKLDDFPYAIAVLFRVFLELSVDHYITSKKLMNKSQLNAAKLRAKLIAVATHLEQSGAMTKRETKILHHIANPQHLLAASIDTLHSYVHDAHFAASPSDLRAAWDSLEPFFAKFWA